MEYVRVGIPKDLHTSLKKLAREEGMTMTDFLRKVVATMEAPPAAQPQPKPVASQPLRLNPKLTKHVTQLADEAWESEIKSM